MKFEKILVIALAASATSATARTINWGGGVGSTNLTSQNVELTSAEFSFEIGYFDTSGGFDVFSSDPADFANNWRQFDSSGYTDALDFFSSSADVLLGQTSNGTGADPLDTFPDGGQAYIWIYNSQNPGQGTEWGIYTNDAFDGDTSDDWLFPASASHLTPHNYFISEATSSPFGSLIENDSNQPGFDGLQTASVVPEPSGALLGLLGLCFVAAQRRRKLS